MIHNYSTYNDMKSPHGLEKVKGHNRHWLMGETLEMPLSWGMGFVSFLYLDYQNKDFV